MRPADRGSLKSLPLETAASILSLFHLESEAATVPLAHASRITGLIALLISVLATPNFTVTGAGFQVVPSFLFTCWCGTLSRSFF